MGIAARDDWEAHTYLGSDSSAQIALANKIAGQKVRTRYSYFIVYPPGSENTGKIQVFQEWLLGQVRLSERKAAIGAQAGKGVAKGPLRLVRARPA